MIQDIYRFVGDINSLTKDADKKTERLGVWLGSGELLYPCKMSTHSYNYTTRFFVVFYLSLIATEEFPQKRGKCHVCVEATV